MELHLDGPRAIHAAAHGMGSRIPPIEITHNINRLRQRGGTIEIDRLCPVFGRVWISGTLGKNIVHRWKVANTWQVFPISDVACESLGAVVRPRRKTRVSGFPRAKLSEDFGLERRGQEWRR